MVILISKHEPRKGTETLNRPSERYREQYISKHEPRKGTETGCWLPPTPRVPRPFQNTNPERGRKQGVYSPFGRGYRISKHEPRKGTETLCLAETDGVPCKVFQNTNPERGRKRLFNTLLVNTFYFKTRTPKGDGNSRRPHALGALVQKISKHEPRKGTETAS